MIRKSTIATTTFLIAGGLIGLTPSIAMGEERNGLNIGDNDSVYIDGKSFQVVPGKAKGDALVQIKNLAARDLGPGAIIIRSGNRLYIADVGSQMVGAQAMAALPGPNYAYDPRAINPVLSGGGSVGYNTGVATNYAYDPRAIQPSLSGGGSAGYNTGVATNYAYDPRAIQPSLSGGGSVGYNTGVATNYAYDPRQGYPIRNPDPWANNYAYDPRFVPAAQPSIIYDRDYVEYRLKKTFEENWTPSAAALGNSH